jgi:F420H(2)-dependent quinone reductase
MATNHHVEPSRAWTFGFRALYRTLRWVDPLLRLWWRGYGLGNVVEVTIVGRHTGKPRRTLLGLLQADGRWYLGHPNGPTQWTHNLDAAGGRLQVSWSESTVVAFWARPLPLGPERDRAILATGQHPFPGNLIYRLARQHVRAAGRYYRLELDAGE